MPLSTQSFSREAEEELAHRGPWAISAYKEGEADGFEDGSTHIFGLYDDEETATSEQERLLAAGGWQIEVCPVVTAPAT